MGNDVLSAAVSPDSERAAQAQFSQGKPLGETCQQCAACKNKSIPCDVDFLAVKDGKTSRAVRCNQPRTREVLAPETPAHLQPLLGSYDAVLELVADWETLDRKPPKKVIELQIEANATGNCPLNEHCKITLSARDWEDRAIDKTWKQATPGPVQVLAHAPPQSGPGRWLAPFWAFSSDVKELEVRATSCGIRADRQPSRELSFLVRVYQNDEYSLTFKVPAFRSLEVEEKGSVDAKGTSERSGSREVKGFGQLRSESSRSKTVNLGEGTAYETHSVGARDGKGYTKLTESEGLKKGDDFYSTSEKYSERRQFLPGVGRNDSIEQEDATDSAAQLSHSSELKVQPTISLKRKGSEVDFTKAINDIVNAKQRLTKAWNDIQHWVPKIGWSAKVELSVFEGSITGSWGNREAKVLAARYAVVETYYDLTFDLKVLTYKLELSFGVDFSLPDLLAWFGDAALFELVLKASGSISGDVSVSEKLESLRNVTPPALASTSTVEIKVVGRVTALAYTYEAAAGVEGGVAFEGTLRCSFDTAPHVDGKFEMKQFIVYARYVDATNNRRSKRYERVIWEERLLWAGKLPG